MSRGKQWTLSDGSVWTAASLSEVLKLTTTACRYRMQKSTDYDTVMRKQSTPVGRRKKHTCKHFVITKDGQPFGEPLSAEEIAVKYDINPSTMYARLLRGQREVSELSKRPSKSRQRNKYNGYTRLKDHPNGVKYQPEEVKDFVLERNFYDPMSRLFLMTA
jgi:hypothetical protein